MIEILTVVNDCNYWPLAKSHESKIMKAFMTSNLTIFHVNIEHLFKSQIPLSTNFLSSTTLFCIDDVGVQIEEPFLFCFSKPFVMTIIIA